MEAELAVRRRRYLDTRTELARLPFRKTLEEFDFGAQPSIDARQIRELATLSFVAHADNVILLEPPGVGKTHLAVSLGLEAIDRGYGSTSPPYTSWSTILAARSKSANCGFACASIWRPR